jgi:hypothetical protein
MIPNWMVASTITIYPALNFLVNVIMIYYIILNYMNIVTFLKELLIICYDFFLHSGNETEHTICFQYFSKSISLLSI